MSRRWRIRRRARRCRSPAWCATTTTAGRSPSWSTTSTRPPRAVVAEVAAEIAARHGVIAVAVSHRVGLLRVGDVALAAAVSAAHRREAFEACSDLVDEVKRRLPVWKRQVFADGSEEWVGSA